MKQEEFLQKGQETDEVSPESEELKLREQIPSPDFNLETISDLASLEQKSLSGEMQECVKTLNQGIEAKDSLTAQSGMEGLRLIAEDLYSRGIKAGGLDKFIEKIEGQQNIQELMQFNTENMPEEISELAKDPHEAFLKCIEAQKEQGRYGGMARKLLDSAIAGKEFFEKHPKLKKAAQIAIVGAIGFIAFGNNFAYAETGPEEEPEEKAEEGPEEKAEIQTEAEETEEKAELIYLSQEERNEQLDDLEIEYAKAEKASERDSIRQEIAQVFIQQNEELIAKLEEQALQQINTQSIELGYRNEEGEMVSNEFIIEYMMSPKKDEVACIIKDIETGELSKHIFNPEDTGESEEITEKPPEEEVVEELSIDEMKEEIREYITKFAKLSKEMGVRTTQAEGDVIFRAMLDVMEHNAETHGLDEEAYQNLLKEIYDSAVKEKSVKGQEFAGQAYFAMRDKIEDLLATQEIEMDEEPVYLKEVDRNIWVEKFAKKIDIAGTEHEQDVFMEDIVRAQFLSDKQTIQGILKFEDPASSYTDNFLGNRFHLEAEYNPDTGELSGVLKDNSQGKELEFKFSMEHFVEKK